MNVVVVYSTEQHQIAWIIAATLRAAVNVMDMPPHTAGTIFEGNQADSPTRNISVDDVRAYFCKLTVERCLF